MPRSLLGTPVDRVLDASMRRARGGGRRFRASSLPELEALEDRRLLANITPSGIISSTPDGANFDYTIKLTNASSSSSGIGTFWYAWIPGQDYLATSPISVTSPTGWTDTITNMGSGDGYAILFQANSSAYYVQPGNSLNFQFTSADTPTSVNGNSVYYSNTPVGTSYVYPAGPFSDAGHIFIVEPAPTPTLSSIAVTPANPSVPKGESQRFDAVGTFSDGSTQDLTSQVTWASATTSVATISNASGSQGLATAVGTGTSAISATLDGITGSTVMTVTAAALESIAVTPANPSVAKGLTQQFTATGTYSDQSTQDLTSQVTWASATTSVATITTAGLATAVGTGTSTISATLSGINGSTVMTVTAAALRSIAVTPTNTTLPTGETEQFTATGTFTDNSTEDLTRQVSWTSSDTTWATISSTGLATAVSPGAVTISASLDGITGSTGLTVTAAALESIAVTPANPSIAKGLTQQFTATGTYSDNSTQNITSQVTWASATTSVATITAAGLASAAGTGTSTISATLGSLTGSTVLTVTPAALVSIAVTPANPSIAQGQTQQFTATGTYTDSSAQDLTGQVTWVSATTSVATITAAGLATAAGTGTSRISATLGSITGSTVLTVTTGALSPVAVKANNQGGYYQYGTWTTHAGGYNGTYAVADPTTSSTASSRWNLTVTAGTYDIYATWVAAGTNATDTGYSIYDGFNRLGTVTANQQLAPSDGQYGGVSWAKLGTFTITNGKITIAMSASGANGNIVANGILLVASVQTAASTAAIMPPSTSAATGAIGMGTTIGPAQDAGATTATAPASATVSVSAPGGAPAPLTPVTVKYLDDSARSPAMSASATPTAPSLIDHAIGEVAIGRHRGQSRSLVKHLARASSPGGKLAVKDHHQEMTHRTNHDRNSR